MMKEIEAIKKIPIQSSDRTSPYIQDESHLDSGSAEAVYLPACEDEIRLLLSRFHRTGTPVTISGSRTGVVGGAVPQGGVIISTERMNRVLGMRRQGTDWLIKVEPGVILKDLQRQIESKSFENAMPLSAHTTSETAQKASKGASYEISGYQDFLSDKGQYFYPPDPTEGTATLGGTVAANSSGARSLMYGPTRGYVQGLRVALAGGDILDIPRGRYTADDSKELRVQTEQGNTFRIPVPAYRMPQVKNAAGYYARPDMDLIDLFIGAEGTLGVITCMELRLIPKPQNILSGVAFFEDSGKALECAQKIMILRRFSESMLRPMALEYFDGHSLELLRRKRQADGTGSVIPEFPSYAKGALFFEQFYEDDENLEKIYEDWQEVLEAYGVRMDDTWGGIDERELEKMKNFRHALPDILNEIFRERKRHYPNIHKISADIAVPDSALEELVFFYQAEIEQKGLEYVLFGHIGESHLHLNILPRTDKEMVLAKNLSREFAKKAASLGGTISAEHGIGKMKHQFLEILYGPDGIREMVRIKLLLDPKGIINRGNIFPEGYLSSPE
ncbi:MAG: FAD-binding oxidoreductase [bacterium]